MNTKYNDKLKVKEILIISAVVLIGIWIIFKPTTPSRLLPSESSSNYGPELESITDKYNKCLKDSDTGISNPRMNGTAFSDENIQQDKRTSCTSSYNLSVRVLKSKY